MNALKKRKNIRTPQIATNLEKFKYNNNITNYSEKVWK